MPNQRRLDLLVAESVSPLAEGAAICSPAIAVLSQWVEDLVVRFGLLEGKAVPIHLDAMQLQLLWQRALDFRDDTHPEAVPFRLAAQARAADRLLRQWYPRAECSGLDEGFFRARKQIAAELGRRQALSPEGWIERLIERLEVSGAAPVTLPERLTLSGFHELTRLEQCLISALQGAGVSIERAAVSAAPPHDVRQVALAGMREELAAAASWARQQRRNGLGRIGIVLNGVDREPQAARRIFDAQFNTAACLHLMDRDDGEFHLPYGEPLLERDVIEDALLLLQLAHEGAARQVPFPRLSRWLLSPFWQGADSERIARSRLDARLRRDGVYGVSITDLRSRAASFDLADELPRLFGVSRQACQTDWRGEDPIRACLLAWGWPGPVAREKETGRAVEAFFQLLERLRELDSMPPSTAIVVLRQMCAEHQLVTRGGAFSPVQLLTPDDAVGLRFEAAWVGNLHADNWPGSPLRNPFLPAQAYRDIPRANPQGELAWSRQLTAGLRQLAPVLVFSWGRQDGDLAHAVSPLLDDIAVTDAEAAGNGALHGQVLPRAAELRGYRDHPWLVAVDDDRGRPLRAAAGGQAAETISGGSAAFVDQSALPMLGYLRHRLGADFADPPEPFADPAWRGSLLHRALQHLYQPGTDPPRRPQPSAIADAIEAALRECRALLRLTPISAEAERLRLTLVLAEWLDCEEQRPPFGVEAVEHPLNAVIAGHPIHLKTDRIDVLPDGRMLVIDYKSRAPAMAGWAGERPREAQLPLYAVLLDGSSKEGSEATFNVGGIVIATVRSGECALTGVVHDAAVAFDKVSPAGSGSRKIDQQFDGWTAAMAHWQACIESLAREIVGGAAVNCVFNSSHPGPDAYQPLLRHAEGEAWRLQRGGNK